MKVYLVVNNRAYNGYVLDDSKMFFNRRDADKLCNELTTESVDEYDEWEVIAYDVQ